MADTKLNDYPARMGPKQAIFVDHTGPASYPGAAGETLGTTGAISIQGLSGLDFVFGSGTLSVSGNYYVIAQPSGVGNRKTWKLLWFAVTYATGVLTLTQVDSTTNLSAETVVLGYLGR